MRTASLPLVLIAVAATSPAAVHGQADSLASNASPVVAEAAATPQPGPVRAPSLADATLPAAAIPGALPAPPVRIDARHSTARLAVGGAAGAAAGFMAGLYLGAIVERGNTDAMCIDVCDDSEGPGAGAVLGALAGESLGMALGVHLANGRQGSLGKNSLASAAILTAGLITGEDSSSLLFALPVMQLIGTITVERAAARSRR